MRSQLRSDILRIVRAQLPSPDSLVEAVLAYQLENNTPFRRYQEQMASWTRLDQLPFGVAPLPTSAFSRWMARSL